MKIYLSKFLLPITQEPFENGALVVDQERIQDCGPVEAMRKKYPKAELEDFGDAILLPGLVNAHCHLELHFAPPYDLENFSTPIGEPIFIQWLIQLAQYQDGLKAEKKRESIREGLKELKASGATTVGDLTTYEGAVSCYQDSGLRVVTYPEVMNLNRKLSQDRFESALAYVDEVMALDNPKIRPGLAPYAPYTLSKNLLKIFYQHIQQLKVPLQIHSSLSFAEMEFFYDSKGDIANLLFPHVGWGESLPPPHQKTPIQYLNDIGFLQVKPALAGCVHLGPTDLALVAHSGSSVICCPRANETLNVGRSPLKKILSNKIPIGLGSESRACNSSLSLWDEMRSAKETLGEGETLNSHELLTMATIGGARTLNLEKEVGSLEKGKWADFIVLRTPEGTRLETLPDQIVDQAGSESILKKFVGGDEIK